MLRLHAECAAARVCLAALAVQGAIQEIAGVKLQGRLGGPDLEDAAGLRLVHFRRLGEPGAGLVEHPVVVVALAELDLLVVGFDAGADGGGRG